MTIRMLNWHVASVQARGAGTIIQCPSINGAMTPDAALDLAVQLVFIANGCMVKEQTNNRVTAWNLNAEFFKRYEAFMTSQVDFVDDR